MSSRQSAVGEARSAEDALDSVKGGVPILEQLREKEVEDDDRDKAGNYQKQRGTYSYHISYLKPNQHLSQELRVVYIRPAIYNSLKILLHVQPHGRQKGKRDIDFYLHSYRDNSTGHQDLYQALEIHLLLLWN